MCCRDLFKTDPEANYKAICSNWAGDDLAERHKSVKESHKAAQQFNEPKKETRGAT